MRQPCLAIFVLIGALSLGTRDLDATTHQVDLVGLSFIPNNLTIEVGDTVHFVWVSGFHNVESGVAGTHDGNFSSGAPGTGQTFDVVFDQPFLDSNPMPGNQYPYYCVVHVSIGMTGQITVDVPQGCDTCAGDANEDAAVNALDIQTFTDCFIGGDPSATGCACADMDESGSFEMSDLNDFVSRLVTVPPPC